MPIIERYQDAVFGIALARSANFHDAQDIAQEAFAEAVEVLYSKVTSAFDVRRQV